MTDKKGEREKSRRKGRLKAEAYGMGKQFRR